MNQIKTQSIVNSIISYLGVALGYVNMGLLFPNVLAKDQLGLVNVIVALVSIIAVFSKLGTANIVIKYFPYFQDSPEKKAKLSSFLISITIVGLLASILLYLIFKPFIIDAYSQNSPMFIDYSNTVIWFLLFFVFFELFFNYSRAALKSIMPTFLRELLWRLLVFIDIVLHYFEVINFDQFLFIYIVSYIVPLTLITIYLFKSGDIGKYRFTLNVGELTKEMMGYGMFALLGGAATVMVTYIDRLMLAGMVDLTAVGIYGTTALFGAVIHVPARALLMIAIPMVAHLLKDEQLDKVDRLYKKSSINQLVTGMFIFLCIYVNMDNLFYFLPEGFEAGKYVIIFIGLAKVFDMATGINGGIILNSKYYRLDAYFNIGLVALTVGTNLLLIPPYGITGAALATAITIFVYNASKGIFVWGVFKIQPFSIMTLVAIAIGAAVLGIDYLLPQLENIYLNILVHTGVATIIFIPLTIGLKVSADINEIVTKMLSKVTGN